MNRKVPKLQIPSWTTKIQAEIISRAHNVVKDVIENYKWDGELNYDTLMHAAILNEEKINKEELELIKKVMYDSNNKTITEKRTSKWLNENPKFRELLKKHFPDAMQKIEGIEIATKIRNDTAKAQNKWKEKKRIFTIFWGLIWLAIFSYRWAAIWFILWYWIWTALEPKKKLEKLLKK